MTEFTPDSILQEIRDAFEGEVQMSEIEREVYYTRKRIDAQYLKIIIRDMVTIELEYENKKLRHFDSTRLKINFVVHDPEMFSKSANLDNSSPYYRINDSSPYFRTGWGYVVVFNDLHLYQKGYFVKYVKLYIDKERELTAENELRVVLQERNERVGDLILKTWWNPHTMFGRMKQQILYNRPFEE